MDDSLHVFIKVHEVRPGVALLFKAGKTPEIRKIPALLRLDRLDGALNSIKKKTFAVFLFNQRKAVSVTSQLGEALDELVLGNSLVRRQPPNLLFTHAHVTRPTATRCASLAFVIDWHQAEDISSVSFVNTAQPGSCAEGKTKPEQTGVRSGLSLHSQLSPLCV